MQHRELRTPEFRFWLALLTQIKDNDPNPGVRGVAKQILWDMGEPGVGVDEALLPLTTLPYASLSPDEAYIRRKADRERLLGSASLATN